MTQLITGIQFPNEAATLPLWSDTKPCAARLLGIGRSSAYLAARSGDIPTIRVGGRVMVSTAVLRRMLGLEDTDGTEGGAA